MSLGVATKVTAVFVALLNMSMVVGVMFFGDWREVDYGNIGGFFALVGFLGLISTPYLQFLELIPIYWLLRKKLYFWSVILIVSLCIWWFVYFMAVFNISLVSG
jgi:hypothetical protein